MFRGLDVSTNSDISIAQMKGEEMRRQDVGHDRKNTRSHTHTMPSSLFLSLFTQQPRPPLPVENIEYSKSDIKTKQDRTRQNSHVCVLDDRANIGVADVSLVSAAKGRQYHVGHLHNDSHGRAGPQAELAGSASDIVWEPSASLGNVSLRTRGRLATSPRPTMTDFGRRRRTVGQ